MILIQNWINNSRNKKGVSSLEIVIGMLTFFIVFCFLLDFLILVRKFSVIAQTTTQVARIASLQGGTSGSPTGYPDSYISSGEITSMVQNNLNAAGIKDGEWSLSGYQGPYDYKEDFTVVLSVNYKWFFMSNIFPGTIQQTITSKKPAMSEWRYKKEKLENWVGE